MRTSHVLPALVLLVLVSGCGGTSPKTVSGVVQDGTTGQPIPNALILVSSSYHVADYSKQDFQYAQTGETGKFKLRTTHGILDYVIANKEGYRADGYVNPDQTTLTMILYPKDRAAQHPLLASLPGIISTALDAYGLARMRETGDEQYCTPITSEYQRNNCYMLVAIQEVSPTLCMSVTYLLNARELCLAAIALRTGNPETCETLPDVRDQCYAQYARADIHENFEGAVWCERIQPLETRDSCYMGLLYQEEQLGRHPPADYCAKIYSRATQEQCHRTAK